MGASEDSQPSNVQKRSIDRFQWLYDKLHTFKLEQIESVLVVISWLKFVYTFGGDQSRVRCARVVPTLTTYGSFSKRTVFDSPHIYCNI